MLCLWRWTCTPAPGLRRTLRCLSVGIPGHRRRPRHLLRLGRGHPQHNAVSALVHAAAQSCDCTADSGSRPHFGADFRPADVLTSVLGNSYTAIDISICSPHVQQAEPDCTQTRRQARLAHYGPHLPSLLRQNISCTPIVWTPRHVDRFALSEQIHRAQRQLCLRGGCLRKASLHSITLEIWKRSARLAALPDFLDPDPWSPRLSLMWSLVYWCPCFSWTVLSLRFAVVSDFRRFARPVSCVAHGSSLSSFGSWRYSWPRWRLWKTWSRTFGGAVWAHRAVCSACRAFAASVSLAFSFAQGRP